MTARLDRAAARSALRKARRMTHSHDTSTPAMSAETVPSGDLARRAVAQLAFNGADRGVGHSPGTLFRFGRSSSLFVSDLDASTLSASHLAKEGGEAGAVEPIEKHRIANRLRGMFDMSMSSADDFNRLTPAGFRLLRQAHDALIAFDEAVAAPAPNPSPPFAAGDAVRSHDVLDEAKINALPLPLIARFAGDKDWLPIHDIGVDAPLCRIDVSGKLEPRRFSEIMDLKDGDGVIHNPDDFYLDADTPTEGPASQTEGMGGDALRDVRLDSEKAEEWPAAQKALWRVVTGENLNDGHYINAYRLTEKLYAAIAALTPPETAEAVPAASDPAPATDDRERLVEAARLKGIQDGLKMARRAYEAHDRTGRDWVKGSLYDTLNREAAARVAALATEASR